MAADAAVWVAKLWSFDHRRSSLLHLQPKADEENCVCDGDKRHTGVWACMGFMMGTCHDGAYVCTVRKMITLSLIALPFDSLCILQ